MHDKTSSEVSTQPARSERVTPQTARKRNVFPFLELPAELRLRIYECAMPKSKDRHLSNNCNESGVRCPHEHENGNENEPKFSHGFLALMSTCQLLYRETLGVLYGTQQSVRPNMVHLHIEQDDIRIGGYSIFCARHHVFASDTERTFSHFRSVKLFIYAPCHIWRNVDWVTGYDSDEDVPSTQTHRDQQASLKDNLRWVVTQLRRVESLSNPLFEQADREYWECCMNGGLSFLDELKFLFEPLRAITSLDRVKSECFGRCTSDGEWYMCRCFRCPFIEDEDTWDEMWGFEQKLVKRMTSKKTAKKEPEIFALFDDFIHNLRKCALTGTMIDVKALVRQARDYRGRGNAESFASILHKFTKEVQKETSQRLGLCDAVKSLKNKAIEIGQAETGATE
ncbi:hypothetical protein IWX90DRAFT_441287 [Phyllosticta citrichinensis]|uniref:Uncharacterized protein n=1 Tax=Phyllosticta citrichinensis TaxID=1130410 RepID=A0ABR1XLQ9_9PEZI